MLETFSFFNTLCTLLSLFIVLLVYKYFAKPYYLINYYKKQGGIGIFNRKLLRHHENLKNAIEKDDYFLIDRQLFKDNPKASFLAENFMSKVLVIIHDLEMAKEFLQKSEIYPKDAELLALIIDIAPDMTVFLQGPEWKKKRKIISSAFNFEFLKNTIPMIVDTTQEKFSEWIKNGELKDVDLCNKLATITGEFTGRFFFGKRFGGAKIDGKPITTILPEVFTRSQREIASLGCLLFGPKYVKAGLFARHRKIKQLKNELRAYCEKMIEETESSSQKGNNLLDVLLNLRRSGNEEDRLTNNQVIDEFIGLFSAGTDTTAHLVNCAIYFLWKNPKVFEKVSKETDKEFSDLSALTLESLNRMEYTNAFLKEALRLGGPAQNTILRVAAQDDNLCGVQMKKGTRVMFRPGMYFTDEKYFPNPKEIIPERWLSDSGYNQSALRAEPYAYIPFLSGPRNCVGQHMAIIEAKILLGMFIKSFKFSFPKDYKFRMIQRSLFEPLHPLLVTLEPKD